MNSALIFCGLVGVVMLVVSLAIVVPELALDSPLELLLSLVSPLRGDSLFEMVHVHIQEGWPETKVVGFLFYGGLVSLGGVAVVVLFKIYLAE